MKAYLDLKNWFYVHKPLLKAFAWGSLSGVVLSCCGILFLGVLVSTTPSVDVPEKAYKPVEVTKIVYMEITPQPTRTTIPTKSPTAYPTVQSVNERCAIKATFYYGDISTYAFIIMDGDDSLEYCLVTLGLSSDDVYYEMVDDYPTSPILCSKKYGMVTAYVVDDQGIIGESFCEGLLSE